MKRIATHTWEHEPITVSIGIATLTDDITTEDLLVDRADEALYTAKRSGRNRAVVYAGEDQSNGVHWTLMLDAEH